ncbi:DUF779 domain-containing protein [Eisenibacter elegans]|jgi:uncharacterized protein (DUF779 family)|uniref:DUF779 domain-containing protein n=1 Tax=Eisenibacter elegans TaxID=997 RepID=UPI000402A386|nr:DUF779 domain-containing protein [Eisenibacter elegans]
MTTLTVQKVTLTPEAAEVIRQLQAEHGDLMFHQSGGCCDGSAPMCYVKGEFRTGDSDVYLGDIEGCPFYIAADQYEYWKHTQIIVHIAPGRGASFSLEIPLGLRFLTQSRVFNEAELRSLGLLH